MMPESVQGPDAPHALPISVVVPVYKEEATIRPFLERLRPVLAQIGDYEILFCVDPSPDNTEEVILAEAQRDPRVGMLVFSRRFGQPAATTAGLLNCRGAAGVVIDVDLQDPPEVILDLYRKFTEGYDVVYATRRSRMDETWIKRLIAKCWYKVIFHISDVPIPADTGDFRIVSRRVIEELRGMRESHGFLRGLVALVGFKQTFVEYDRKIRSIGASKYSRIFGSYKIAFNGVMGFSTFPLSFMLWAGFVTAGVGLVGILYMLIMKFIVGLNYPLGIPTITITVLFFGGVQLMGIGILGEYIGRIYDEVRQRPLFIVDRAYNVTVKDRWGRGR